MSTRITTKAVLFAVAIMATASLFTHAAPGDLDLSFGTGGWVTTSIAPSGARTDYAFAVGLQSDGKVVVAGYTLRGSGSLRKIALTRYTMAGVLDTTFGTSGIVTTTVGLDSAAQGMSIQSDDKIVVAGFAEVSGNGYDFNLVRYLPDGGLDGSFGSGGVLQTVFQPHTIVSSSHATAVLALAGGRILAAGNADVTGSAPSDNSFALARYESNGGLDLTFDTDGKVETNIAPGPPVFESIQDIAVQPDGKIVAAGYTPDGSGTNYDFAVARYNADGSLDMTFDGDGVATVHPGVGQSQALGVAIQSVGGQSRIIVAGYADNGSYLDITLVRYLPDGSLDTGFGVGGIVTTDAGVTSQARDVRVDAAGRIVVSGTVDGDFALAAYDLAGVLDPSFGVGGIVTTDLSAGAADLAGSLVLQSDGKIVAAGYSSGTAGGTGLDFAVARYAGLAVVELHALSRGAAVFLVVLAFVALGYAVIRLRGTRARIGDIRLSP